MKHFIFLGLYVAVGLIISGLLVGVLAKALPSVYGSGTAAPAA